MRRTFTMLAIFGLGAAWAATGSGADGAADKGPKVGDPVPAFSMTGSDGKKYTLEDFKGKKVLVLAWFPKAFTGGCTAECKSMRASGDKIRKYEVAYFTASCDTPEDNQKFAESLGLDFPILSDPETGVARAYGVVDDEQKRPRRWTYYVGLDGKILAIDKEVKTANYGDDIAAKLEELGVTKK